MALNTFDIIVGIKECVLVLNRELASLAFSSFRRIQVAKRSMSKQQPHSRMIEKLNVPIKFVRCTVSIYKL